MYFTNQHNIIESDDIANIEHIHIVKEGEQIIAHIKAVLDPHKNYQARDEVHFHLTNGINHRTLGPFKHANPVQKAADGTEHAPVDGQAEDKS